MVLVAKVNQLYDTEEVELLLAAASLSQGQRYPEVIASAVVMEASKMRFPGVLNASSLISIAVKDCSQLSQPPASSDGAVCPPFPFWEQVSTASISSMQINPTFRI